MTVNDFRDLYLAELEELRSVEAQMAEHLDRLAEQATDPRLLSQEIEAYHRGDEARAIVELLGRDGVDVSECGRPEVQPYRTSVAQIASAAGQGNRI